MNLDDKNNYTSKDFYLCALLFLFPKTGFVGMEKDVDGTYWCSFSNEALCKGLINNYLKNELKVSAREFISAIKMLKERMLYSKQ